MWCGRCKSAHEFSNGTDKRLSWGICKSALSPIIFSLIAYPFVWACSMEWNLGSSMEWNLGSL